MTSSRVAFGFRTGEVADAVRDVANRAEFDTPLRRIEQELIVSGA